MAANILVVEDQRAIAGALRMRLRGLGYGVLDIAKDADEAIAKAATLKPDLISWTSVSATAWTASKPRSASATEFDIPVIYVTAYADRALLDRARATHPRASSTSPSRPRTC